MEKDFDRWNREKKDIHTKEKNLKFHDGEIWWCIAGLNVGHEIDGKNKTFERPFYILKKCNTTMFIGIPCTSHYRKGLFMYILETDNLDFILNFSQIKAISSKRLLRKIVNVSTKSEKEINIKFVEYIKRKPAQ